MKPAKLKSRLCPCGRVAVANRGGPVCSRCRAIERERFRAEKRAHELEFGEIIEPYRIIAH